MISNKILHFCCITLVFLVGCGEESLPEVVEPDNEPIVKKNNFQFKSYKRIAPLSNMERYQLGKRSDIQNAGRNLLKTFDKNKSKINSSSQE